jgi:hypothetical protein
VHSRPGNGYPQRTAHLGFKPQQLVDLMTLFVVSAAAISMLIAPYGLALPAFASIMLLAGGALGLFAWYRGMPQQRSLSVWDISGSMLALGFCSALLSDDASISALLSL